MKSEISNIGMEGPQEKGNIVDRSGSRQTFGCEFCRTGSVVVTTTAKVKAYSYFGRPTLAKGHGAG
jgi:hypothetical protein